MRDKYVNVSSTSSSDSLRPGVWCACRFNSGSGKGPFVAITVSVSAGRQESTCCVSCDGADGVGEADVGRAATGGEFPPSFLFFRFALLWPHRPDSRTLYNHTIGPAFTS